jgi:hypothetical protein
MIKLEPISDICFDDLPEHGLPMYGYCTRGLFDIKPVSFKWVADELKRRAHRDFLYFPELNFKEEVK